MTRPDEVIERVSRYHPEADTDLLHRAFTFCRQVCLDRSSGPGKAVWQHSVEVASLLAQLQLDIPSIVAGILHDTIRDGGPTLDEIARDFGADIAELVEGVNKIGRIAFKKRAREQAESFRKMLLAMARDIRVILVKLADRLHTMRTLDSRPPEQQLLLAQETMEVFAPLANRMGIGWIKNELENLSFRYLYPAEYRELSRRLARRKREHARYIEEIKRKLENLLAENRIDGQVSGRAKHLYSIFMKMKRQGIEFDQVHDLIAFRIILKTVQECYAVLGMVHALWKPIPGRFKDYIAMPKANMYQSLHTTVMGPHGERMEIQLRTEEMHRIAEEGIAAHWKYKEGGGPVAATAQHDRRFAWLRQILEWQKDLSDSREFLSVVKVDLFPEEVYVFTPNGDVKELPRGSTPIDFAYAIHSDIGHHCVGARVNGKLVPLKTELQNGDIVEVVTSPHQAPSKDWLKFVRTSKARNKIRHWIKTEQRQKSIELGRELLEKKLRKYGMGLKKVQQSEAFEKAWRELGFTQGDDMLAALGYGKVSLGQVVSRIVPREKLDEEGSRPTTPLGKVVEKIRRKPSSAIRLQGVEDILVRFARCCSPLPGDEVVGFITRGRGITVHTADCTQVQVADPERRVSVEWDMKKKSSRPVKIRVFCEDQKGMLAGITAAITNCEANIISATVRAERGRKGINTFEIDVQDLAHLNRVRQAVLNVKGVYRVDRIRGQ
ncbi:GTP pyrophosphokinase [Geothermobacter ehrlichii]|uniref:GTP pyrophosphokinase n=1 Tax=Geothermobacter ehrlichii TaxID=213224 RepID=A0A5D3WMJ5_9BACT|nr:bifunctional (p)ppGpp synthetase/guanosine-3',5'-bis(diphosphate) 3'-pyrophosphohydrolase [Geothermobacter ehrlichii]TYP00081.1 GTP pyrophosphokinase [Geothermobacter ehrlichii]